MTDVEVYELGLKALTENLGLTETTRFLQICQPHKSDPARSMRPLSDLKMERIREKVYKAYVAKQPESENQPIKKITSLSSIALYELGIKVISDKLGPVGMAQFIRIRKPSTVDYTAERHKWLDKLDRDTILEGIQQIQRPR